MHATERKKYVIINFKPQKSIKDARPFYGMGNFLSSFIKDLRKHMIPIYEIQKKESKLKGMEEFQIIWENQSYWLTYLYYACQKATDMFRLKDVTSKTAAGGALFQIYNRQYASMLLLG